MTQPDRSWHRCAISSLLILAACAGAPEATDAPTYVRDVQPLVAARCAGCHTEGGIGPFPLKTYEQVRAMKEAIAAAVTARTMPPWQAAEGCTDYRGDFSLTQQQIDTIARWVKDDAPLGDPASAPVPVEDRRLTLSRVDHELPIPEPYTPQLFPDDYRCFFLAWPAADTRYITGFGIEPGNPSIVHHAIAYVVRPDKVPVFQALDDADPKPGWTCFGGPGGEGGGPGQVSWLGGWAPGGNGADFPAGTGIEIPTGAKIIVQVHYNSLRAPAPDRTKVLLRSDATVQKKAGILPFADAQWVLARTLKIPARSRDVVRSYAADPTTLISILTGGAIANGKPLTVYDAGMHMHTLGRRGLLRFEHADGGRECLLDIPRWDFHWQSSHMFATPKRVMPGDKLYLECQWDNPRDTDVGWGEGTNDEMCLGIHYLTE